MDEITQLLEKEIPDDPHSMSDHERKIEGWRFRVSKQLLEEERTLTEQINLNQLAKSKNITDIDRKNHTSFKTRDQQYKVDFLKSVLVCIDKRLTVIQSQRKFITEEYKRI